MIELDIDLSFLAQHFDLGSRRVGDFRNKSINEIIQEGSGHSRTLASKLTRELLKNPRNVYKLFKLTNPNNRYLLLSHMDETDLMYILQFLDIKDLMMGMAMFTKDMLLKCLMLLPPESLMKVVGELMEPEKFLENMPEDMLDEFLSSDKIEPEIYLKALQNMPEDQLKSMMQRFTGKSQENSTKTSMITEISQLDKSKMKKTMLMFDLDGKRKLALNIMKEKPELMAEFSTEAMAMSMKNLDKEKIVEAMGVLSFQDFSKMFEQMPQELLAMVATQIDPQMFAIVLSSDFDQILGQISS